MTSLTASGPPGSPPIRAGIRSQVPITRFMQNPTYAEPLIFSAVSTISR